jgi:hypothetical protein
MSANQSTVRYAALAGYSSQLYDAASGARWPMKHPYCLCSTPMVHAPRRSCGPPWRVYIAIGAGERAGRRYDIVSTNTVILVAGYVS